MRRVFFSIVALVAMVCGMSIDAHAGKKDVKVISFNITVSNSNGENMWEQRRPAVVNMIHEEMPDVVGMQEATVFQLKQLEPLLSDYELYYVARGGRNSPNECTAIAVNTLTMEIVDKGTFWLSPTPDTPSRSWSDEKTTQLELYLGGKDSQKYNRTCSWVKLRRKADGKEFFCFNTHLEFGYHAMHGQYPEELGLMGQTAREKGVELIAQKMQAMMGKKQAVIFCGDMNQVIGDKCFEPLWEMGMEDGRLEAKSCPSEANRNSVTWNGFKFSAPNKAPTQESEEKAQGYGNFFMIDHFFIKNCKAMEYRTLRDKRYGEEPMPAEQAYMSDHFPVMLTVRF